MSHFLHFFYWFYMGLGIQSLVKVIQKKNKKVEMKECTGEKTRKIRINSKMDEEIGNVIVSRMQVKNHKKELLFRIRKVWKRKYWYRDEKSWIERSVRKLWCSYDLFPAWHKCFWTWKPPSGLICNDLILGKFIRITDGLYIFTDIHIWSDFLHDKVLSFLKCFVIRNYLQERWWVCTKGMWRGLFSYFYAESVTGQSCWEKKRWRFQTWTGWRIWLIF